jgi:hypothetical protein
MDMGLAMQICNFYVFREPWVTICARVLNSMIFDGGAAVELKLRPSGRVRGGSSKKRSSSLSMETEEEEDADGDNEASSENTTVLDEQLSEHLLTLAKEALDYRRMLGMVPIRFLVDPEASEAATSDTDEPVAVPTGHVVHHVADSSGNSTTAATKSRKRKFQTRVPVRLAEVVSLNSGMFALQYPAGDDMHVMKPRVIWMDNRSPGIEATDVKVFVWPGCEPLMGHYRSDILTVFPRFIELQRLLENRLAADDERSHPIILVGTRPDNKKPEDLAEEDLLAQVDIMGADPDNNRTYKRSVQSRIQTDLMQQMMFAKQGTTTQDVVSTTSGRIQQVSRGTAAVEKMDRFVPLPDGGLSDRINEAHSLENLEEVRAQYILEVCQAMQVPRAYLENAGRPRDTAGAQQAGGTVSRMDQDRMRQTVIGARMDVETFVSFVYEHLFEGSDNKLIADLFLDLDRERLTKPIESRTRGRLRLGARGSDSSRFLFSEADLMQFQQAAWGTRIKVRFFNRPVPVQHELQEIYEASDRGLLTEAEELNLVRTRLGLRACPADAPPTHPLVKRRRAAAAAAAEAAKPASTRKT